MIAAPLGLPGHLLIDPFLRMAQGLNDVNEHNTALGTWTHKNGWGGVYTKDEHPEIVRSVEACWEDVVVDALRDERVLLLHARRASRGGVSIENTHPFEHEIDGARWYFCHNGTVRDDLPTSSTLTTKPTTDSEKIFHLLLPHLRVGQVLRGFREVYSGFSDFTSLNTFLLGSDSFWAVSLCTQNPIYYALTLSKPPDGPVVSSEPLVEFPAAPAIDRLGESLLEQAKDRGVRWIEQPAEDLGHPLDLDPVFAQSYARVLA